MPDEAYPSQISHSPSIASQYGLRHQNSYPGLKYLRKKVKKSAKSAAKKLFQTGAAGVTGHAPPRLYELVFSMVFGVQKNKTDDKIRLIHTSDI